MLTFIDMPSNKRKSEFTEVLAGGSVGKKGKTTFKDPFSDRFGEVIVEIIDLGMPDICDKLFSGEHKLKFEVKNYKSELIGVSKTVCGETRFIEDFRASLVITYEKDKKDEMIEELTTKFPQCTYSFR